MRHARCDHDPVYSGQTNLSCKFAYICSKCGQCGWSETYVLAQVNFDEFCRQRVLHGWSSPKTLDASVRRMVRLSAPIAPSPPPRWRLRTGVLAAALAGIVFGWLLWKVTHG